MRTIDDEVVNDDEEQEDTLGITYEELMEGKVPFLSALGEKPIRCWRALITSPKAKALREERIALEKEFLEIQFDSKRLAEEAVAPTPEIPAVAKGKAALKGAAKTRAKKQEEAKPADTVEKFTAMAARAGEIVERLNSSFIELFVELVPQMDLFDKDKSRIPVTVKTMTQIFGADIHLLSNILEDSTKIGPKAETSNS